MYDACTPSNTQVLAVRNISSHPRICVPLVPQVIVASAEASFSLLGAALAAATTAGVDTAAAHVQWAQLKEQATKHTLEQALSVSNAIADSNAAIEAGGAPVVMGARVRVKPSVTEPKCVAQAPPCTRLFPKRHG